MGILSKCFFSHQFMMDCPDAMANVDTRRSISCQLSCRCPILRGLSTFLIFGNY